MKKLIGFILIFLPLFLVSCSEQKHIRSSNYTYSKPVQLNDSLKTATLENVGIDSSKIIELTKLILADSFPNIHSLLILKDNQLVYENYFAGNDQISGKNLGYIEHNLDDLHDCRSISKSIVSACVGIAIKQGLIKNIDVPIFDYFPEYEKYKDEKKGEITIRHLLTMTSGLDWNEEISYNNFGNSELKMDFSFSPIRFILSRSMVADAGTKWNYCGGNTQLLAEIIKKVSGFSIDKFAEKHLFLPLGIKNYVWLPLIMTNSKAAASGLRLRSRDFMKFGLLYMNNGKLNGVQILDEAWVQQSLSGLVPRPFVKSNTINRGYGLQFWTYTDTIKNQKIDISEAKGNGGNAIFFCKSLNLLVVVTAGNYNQWDIVNNSHAALVNYIIPAIK